MNNVKKKNIKIYLIATEPSGDTIGANLIRSLKKKKGRNIKIFGIGGPKMINSGLKKSLFGIDKLSIFGLFEVIPKIFKVLKLLEKTKNDLLRIKPDILITIDSPDFNFRILRKIHKILPQTKKVHYVAPTVWAWRSGRAKYLSKYINKLLTILPFEKRYFSKYNLKTEFVGHPVFELSKKQKSSKRILEKYKINKNYKIVSLLPGSRLSEIKKILPVLNETVNLINKDSNIKIHFLFYILPHLNSYFKKFKFSFPHSIINDKDKYNAFKVSHAAISTSGTAALELSYFKVPTIVIYKLNLFSFFLAKIFVKIKYANILNILENKYIIPEYLQFRCNPYLISNELFKLINNKSHSSKQIHKAQKALGKLKKNRKLPSINVVNELF